MIGIWTWINMKWPGPKTVKAIANQVRTWSCSKLVSLCNWSSLWELYLLCVWDCYSPLHNSTTDLQVHQFPPNPKQLILMGTPPPAPFICWPLLKGHMQLSGGHCLENKGQLLSHDLTKGTAAVNRFYALLMFSRHLFLLTKCFFKLCYASALGFTTGSSQCFRALQLELASPR